MELFDQITSFDALERATYRAISGKRRKNTAAAFMARLEIELPRLEQQVAWVEW
ncbi:hypothetical protein MNBD_GAMMA26-2503 [hydrothermal vent metagenome]|uniref:Uncharacterized protein n=1 Tax=hydrothermal vent metagenome TaxID=652676 RepID=A0A3B1BHZ0_9ZZZZ